MKRLVVIFSLILAMLAIMQINSANAARKVIDNVFYINQVEDMDKSKFLGHNSCGPTSAVMLVRFHNVQQIPNSCYKGWYVWNSYDAITDRLGNYYDARLAMDMDSNFNHIHSVCGAHGFIVVEKDGDWLTNPIKLVEYIENHGLVVKEIRQNYFQIIKQNIDAGLPLLGHSIIKGNKHYLVIVGYDTGSSGNEQKVVVNDPYGNANVNWFDTQAGGEKKTYPLDGYCGSNRVKIDYVYTIHPIGIYHWLPGWRASIFTQSSQPFVDCYNKDRNGISGKDVFGIPWNNSPEGSWVHQWPNGSSSYDTIFLQDFIDWNNNGHWWQLVLNQGMNEVFPVHGKILSFWHNNCGYLNYGEPICEEYYATHAINGHQMVVQEFQKDSNVRYIGYDTVSGELGEYTFYQISFPGSGSGLYDPENLMAQAISSSQINLAWDRGLNPPEYENLRYRIYRDGTEIATTANTNYLNSGLNSETQYCYKATAYIDDNESSHSDQVCATTHSSGYPSSPDYAFNRSTTCKNVQPDNPWNPISETTLFYNSDNLAYSWIQLDDVYKSLNINWKWYNSNGAFIYEYTNITDDPADYGWDYWGWYRSCSSLSIASHKNYGQWRVDIYIDSQKVAANYFILTVDLSAPTGLSAEAIGESEISLNWNAAASADGYKIYRNNELIAETANLYYLDINLASDTQYCYKVKTYRGNANSEYSSQLCAATLPVQTIPDPPIGLRVIEIE